MRDIIQQLHDGNLSLVVRSGNNIRTFTKPGVADLLSLLNHEPETLRGALVADKMVGKAAAALLLLGRVGEVYADVISAPAREFLEENQIPVTFRQEVPFVMNRQQNGWCPLEKLAFLEYNPQTIKEKIEEFIRKG